MIFSATTPELRFAMDAVREASLLVKQVQAEMAETRVSGELALTKEDRSPVTVADFAAQAVVGRLLQEAFPDDALVAEEDSETLRTPEGRGTLEQVAHFVARVAPGASTDSVCEWIDRGNGEPSGRYWVLDPIDGTKGFLRGAQYAVALGLIEDGMVRLGVLGCPNLTNGSEFDIGGPGSLVVAARGQGTWMTALAVPAGAGEFTRLRVSAVGDSRQARLLRSVESGHTNVGRMGQLIDLLAVEAEPVLMDSQAKYAVLAAGKGDLLFRLLSKKQPDYRERIWDQAAGSIVVEEAGGRITDLHGAPLDFTQGRTLARNEGVCASNGLLHDAALAALGKIEIRPS